MLKGKRSSQGFSISKAMGCVCDSVLMVYDIYRVGVRFVDHAV